jgi:hypothetical protein
MFKLYSLHGHHIPTSAQIQELKGIIQMRVRMSLKMFPISLLGNPNK